LNRKLYLHETITIVGAGSEPYKRATASFAATRREGGALVGIWQQSGSTGDWPRVVNLWEMDGWDHWARILAHQYAGRAQPPALKRWWARMLRWRSGGFDRILEPAEFSPTRQDLIDAGVRGAACLQEIATTLPGAADAYLAAVRDRWIAPARDDGVVLLGAWRTAMRDTEAVLHWSVPDFAAFTRHVAGPRRTWAETARTWRTDVRETLLVPSPWCVTHPAWRPPRRRA